MMSRDGNAKHPGDCRPHRLRRFRRCQSRRLSHLETSRCCRSSPPNALDMHLEETKRVLFIFFFFFIAKHYAIRKISNEMYIRNNGKISLKFLYANVQYKIT